MNLFMFIVSHWVPVVDSDEYGNAVDYTMCQQHTFEDLQSAQQFVAGHPDYTDVSVYKQCADGTSTLMAA